jgi:ligand-binding sensor domain-containing protein/two-component sensor histidine kinase
MDDIGHVIGFKGHRLTPWALVLGLEVMLAGFCLRVTHAAGATNVITPYNVRSWQTDDGLPQNSVYAIAQTADGYLWVGTGEGLARFDGVRFTMPDETAPPELRRGLIPALCADRDGSLWIGCDGFGIAHWKDGKFTRFSEADGLVSNQIRCLLQDPDGTLWIGSEGGLARYKDGKFTNFAEKNGLADDSVRGLCRDRKGNLRMATPRGLSTLDQEGIIRTFNIMLGTPANSLKFVCQDNQGRTWTGGNEGLNCVDGEAITTFGVSDGLPAKMVLSAREDRRGQLWVGTIHGLARMVQGRFVPWQTTRGTLVDQVHTLFEDREGNLWAGGQDGLYCLTPARFTAYTTLDGLSRDNVMSVCEDSSGTMWIGTWEGGLNRLKNEQISAFGTVPGLKNGQVLGLHPGRDGSLWVGLDHGGGLFRIKDGAQTQFARAPDLFESAVRVIEEDRAGALWIGTSRGLNVFEAGKFRGYTTTDGLAGNVVLALCEDGRRGLWIGTDGGLSRWDGGKLNRFAVAGGPAGNPVNALYLDPNQALWIGTRGAGLFRYKEGKCTSYTTRQGLFSDEIYEIVEDDYACLWMSCRRGIFRAHKKQFEDLDRGAARAVVCSAFGRSDGLPTVQCNGVAKPAGWKSRDGRLWFPTIRGVVAVEPALKTNLRPPPVLIEEVIADGYPLQSNSLVAGASLSLTVPPGHGRIEIHYTALSFQAPERNRFKYRLERIDPGWVDAGTRRLASYENIAPGQYRFYVTGCNNDGIWNETGAALVLDVTPHDWETWWFKVLIGLGIVMLLVLLYRLRVTRLRAIERLRVQIAANLHDDVGARLTKVGMLTELVDRETTESNASKPHIRNLARTVREITQAMDEIVWTINPKNDSVDHLANYIFQYTQEYFQGTGVSCRLDLPPQLPDRPMSTEARHNLFMAVKEALNNSLKHARATEVRVELGLKDGHMIITLSDNGLGFEPGQVDGKGDGLENMRRRLEQIGGRLVLESHPGGGTHVRMEVQSG